ncbi:Maf family protein [bacterium]|nr:Maf family protein [bacterium]
MKSLSSENIILASEASWRSDILTRLGIVHRCVKHKYPEPFFESGSLVDFVKNIALEKAVSIQNDNLDAMIISADQLIDLDDDVFYKSGSRDNAVRQLQKLSGRQHRLICAVAVLYGDKRRVAAEEAFLTMRELTVEEIENYVDRDKPWDCAGSYKIESLGASLFSEINVKDPTTIVGIPGNLLIDILRDWGFSNLV